MRTEMKISELCAGLDPALLDGIEPTAAPGAPAPSAERVKALVLERLRVGDTNENPELDRKINQNEGKPMKKPLRILLIAALVVAIPLTVFAAARGGEIYRAIFGESVDLVDEHLQSDPAAVENETHRLAVESLLTDGYVIHLVAALSDLEGGSLPDCDLRVLSEDLPLNTVSVRVLDEFSSEAERYYLIELGCDGRFESGNLQIMTDAQALPLSLSMDVENRQRAITLDFPADDPAGDGFRVDQLQLSPMGFLLIGSESERAGGLPAALVILRFADGTRELLTDGDTFDDEDDGETIMSGGMAVIVDDYAAAPLVLSATASRNPDGEVVTAGRFSRIIDLDAVTAVEIDGTLYPIE